MKTTTGPFLNRARKSPPRPLSRFLNLLVAIFAGLSLAVPPSEAAQPQPHNLTVLPEIEGAVDLIVLDSNNQGQIIGIYFDIDWNAYGFVYAHGVYTGLEFIPSRINERGQTVGITITYDSNYELHSFVFDQGSYTSIAFPGAVENSTLVSGINDRGQIIGSYSDGPKDHGFIYDKGLYNALPDVPGARLTYPQSINNRGQIVGWSYDSNFEVQSFIFDKGVYTFIDAPSAATGTFPSDINEKGQIVGYSQGSDFMPSSFMYESGVHTGIEIPGALFTVVYGINDRGQITGTYYDEEWRAYGFVLSR